MESVFSRIIVKQLEKSLNKNRRSEEVMFEKRLNNSRK